MDAKSLASELAPTMVQLLEKNKDAIVAGSGNWLARKATAAAWPNLLGMVPALLESQIELVAWKFGKITMEEVVDLLTTVRKDSPEVGAMLP